MQRSIRQQLKRLPYREMRTLTSDIADALDSSDVDEHALAEVITALPTDMSDDEMELRRRELLAQFFHRKKQITVQPDGKGWSIQIPTAGLVIRTDDIQEGITEMVEALIAYTTLE